MSQLIPPEEAVTIRMYRQGHGDCFLLAFSGFYEGRVTPVYMLIDCGLKPGSDIDNVSIEEIIDDIFKATKGRLDYVVVTHEHQDHVNGFSSRSQKRGKPRNFERFEIGQVILAWTEDPEDRFANKLRNRFNDQLLILARAFTQADQIPQQELGIAQTHSLDTLKDLLELEFDGIEDCADLVEVHDREIDHTGYVQDSDFSTHLLNNFTSLETPLAADSDGNRNTVKGKRNKAAIQYLTENAQFKTLYMRPDRGPYQLDWIEDVNFFTLGPPRSTKALLDLDPRDDEEFHLDKQSDFALAELDSLLAVNDKPGSHSALIPFSSSYGIPQQTVFDTSPRQQHGDLQQAVSHYQRIYRTGEKHKDEPKDWRQLNIDQNGWLDKAGTLALRLNNEVNNTSLVLAIELGNSGKVLLFTGDAQRGSWASWGKLSWRVEGTERTAKELLANTVLYKVGHHGSHNATLDGTEESQVANLSWLGSNATTSDEFVSMIPAHQAWAENKSSPWSHPMPAIKKALTNKSRGRVFQSDKRIGRKPAGISDGEWEDFKDNMKQNKLYAQYTVMY